MTTLTKEQILQWVDIAAQRADDELQSHGEYHPDWHTVRDSIFATLARLDLEADLEAEIAELSMDVNPIDLREICIATENKFMLVLAYRIAGNSNSEEDARIEVAYSIARYLKLDWPSAYENEPVAWMNPCNGVTVYNGMKTLHPDRYQNFSIPCFPLPNSTEQIENRVAEACAKLLDTQWNGDADTYAEAEIANQCANSIRSGAWKEYLK